MCSRVAVGIATDNNLCWYMSVVLVHVCGFGVTLYCP